MNYQVRLWYSWFMDEELARMNVVGVALAIAEALKADRPILPGSYLAETLLGHVASYEASRS